MKKIVILSLVLIINCNFKSAHPLDIFNYTKNPITVTIPRIGTGTVPAASLSPIPKEEDIDLEPGTYQLFRPSTISFSTAKEITFSTQNEKHSFGCLLEARELKAPDNFRFKAFHAPRQPLANGDQVSSIIFSEKTTVTPLSQGRLDYVVRLWFFNKYYKNFPVIMTACPIRNPSTHRKKKKNLKNNKAKKRITLSVAIQNNKTKSLIGDRI